MPVASPDRAVTLPGHPVTIRVLDNDQGEALTLIGLSSPAHGSVTINPDQSLVYAPAPGFAGEDSFTYRIQDAAGATAEAIVDLLVDAPPLAVDDTALTAAATPVVVPVLANDLDPEGQPLTVVAVAAPGHGTVEIPGDGTLRYTPQHGFAGSDSFTYSVADPHGATASAMVTVGVSDPNRRPVARADSLIVSLDAPTLIQLAANDDDPDGDALALHGFSLPQHGALQIHSADSVVYTPAAGFIGEDGFDYTMGDGHGGTATATVRITVRRPNAPPVAGDISLATASGTPVSVAPLAHASDPDSDPLTLSAITLPSHGQLGNRRLDAHLHPGCRLCWRRQLHLQRERPPWRQRPGQHPGHRRSGPDGADVRQWLCGAPAPGGAQAYRHRRRRRQFRAAGRRERQLAARQRPCRQRAECRRLRPALRARGRQQAGARDRAL